MELPKINSIRSKEITLNGKKITLIPWTNIQLVNYEESLNDSKKLDSIQNLLLKDNYKCKQKLTYTEKRYILIELYILSKSSIIDIKYECVHCKNDSNLAINLSNSTKWNNLKERTFKIDNWTFNLKANSCYDLDTDKDLSLETLKYFVSFIDSLLIDNKEYPIMDLDEATNWFSTEVPNTIFSKFLLKMNEIKPDFNVDVTGICEHCGESSKINFRIEDFLE